MPRHTKKKFETIILQYEQINDMFVLKATTVWWKAVINVEVKTTFYQNADVMKWENSMEGYNCWVLQNSWS